MTSFEQSYDEAVASGRLPGVALMATDKTGSFTYSKTIGVRSLRDKSGSNPPMELSTIVALASCTKIMTAIAAIQCVERGLLSLDADVTGIIPEAGRYGIITGFNEEKNEPITEPLKSHMTLRHLLTHTSGQAYDLAVPLLTRWRSSRSEVPWDFPTVVEKTSLPLTFQPGSAWSYGGSLEWAGLMVERVTHQTLEDYMRENIWTPLGLGEKGKEMTFWPRPKGRGLEGRIADLSVLLGSEGGERAGKVLDLPGFEVTGGAKECLGGAGAYGSVEAFFEVVKAVLNEDERLLGREMWGEMFAPQLGEGELGKQGVKGMFNALLRTDQKANEYCGCNMPTEVEKEWSFAGLRVEQDIEGWMRKGSVLWGGFPCIVWFVDREAGLCGLAACQVVPPMAPPVMELHEGFQRGAYEMLEASRQD